MKADLYFELNDLITQYKINSVKKELEKDSNITIKEAKTIVDERIDSKYSLLLDLLKNLKEDNKPVKLDINTEQIKLSKHGLFAERKTIQEAIDYANQFDIHTLTAVMVLYNTIAGNYNLIKKES